MLHSFLLAALLQGAVPVTTAEPVHTTADVLAPIYVVPVRTLRPAQMMVEAGFNGLSGIGLQFGYNFHPHFALDIGGGLSAQTAKLNVSQTAKLGLRARYNVLKSDVTPFVAIGAVYGFGTPSAETATDRNNTISYKIDRSPFAQAVVGVSWVNRRGVSLMASAGWNQLLRGNNILMKSGRANDRQNKAFKALAGSGPSGSVAVGYAF